MGRRQPRIKPLTDEAEVRIIRLLRNRSLFAGMELILFTLAGFNYLENCSLKRSLDVTLGPKCTCFIPSEIVRAKEKIFI